MGWLDVVVTALLVGFGLGLAVVILIDGGSAFHAALALVFVLAVVLRWARRESFAWETLTRWWRSGEK